MTYLKILLAVFILSACNQMADDKDSSTFDFGWRPIYKHDENGNLISGNIDSLIAGIRNGYSVRVGWGWERELGDSIMRLEHIAEPIYLSIIQEKNVSAIIDAHPLLESYFDTNKQNFGEGGHYWQCILSTQGTFNAKVYHRSSGELLKDWPQRHRMTWFLEYPYQRHKNTNKSLYK